MKTLLVAALVAIVLAVVIQESTAENSKINIVFVYFVP